MKKKIFIFQATDFKFIYLLAGWKLVINAKFHPKLHQLGKKNTGTWWDGVPSKYIAQVKAKGTI